MSSQISRAEQLAEWVLESEGGWSNHPADRGGKTNFGITEATARRYGYRVEQITFELARWILAQPEFWSFDFVGSDKVARKLLDISTNSGKTTAIRLLQRALRLTGYSVDEDGIAGPATKSATNRCRDYVLVAALAYVQADRFVEITKNDPSQKVFLEGWLVRAMKV